MPWVVTSSGWRGFHTWKEQAADSWRALMRARTIAFTAESLCSECSDTWRGSQGEQGAAIGST